MLADRPEAGPYSNEQACVGTVVPDGPGGEKNGTSEEKEYPTEGL